MKEISELDNTSIVRIRQPKQISEPIYIDLRDLEAFQEIPTKSRIRQSSDNAADHV